MDPVKFHETFGLINEWSNTIFRLANDESLSDVVAFSAIRAVAVAIAQQAALAEGYTPRLWAGSEKPSLVPVPCDPEREV